MILIGLYGQGTLDKVAGPVGEALIMTALGLAVAIPAVLAYNAFVRRNRIWLARLDAFAHDLFVLITVGGDGSTNGNRGKEHHQSHSTSIPQTIAPATTYSNLEERGQ